MSQYPPTTRSTRRSNMQDQLYSSPPKQSQRQAQNKTNIKIEVKIESENTRQKKNYQSKDTQKMQIKEEDTRRSEKLLGKGKNVKKESPQVEYRTRTHEVRGRSQAKIEENTQKAVKRHTKEKAQDLSKSIKQEPYLKRQKVSPSRSHSKGGKSTKSTKSRNQPCLTQVQTTRSTRRNPASEIISIETSHIISKALKQHDKKKQEAKYSQKSQKTTRNAKSAQPSTKQSQKTSKAPSRRGNEKIMEQTFSQKARKVYSQAVSRKDSASPLKSQNTRRSIKKEASPVSSKKASKNISAEFKRVMPKSKIIDEFELFEQQMMEFEQQNISKRNKKKVIAKDDDIKMLEDEIDKFKNQQQVPVKIEQIKPQISAYQEMSLSQIIGTPIKNKPTPTSIYNTAQIKIIKDKDVNAGFKKNEQYAKEAEIKIEYREEFKQEEDQQMIDETISQANSIKITMNQTQAIPENIRSLLTLNLLSKETLEMVRRAFSNKPTPSLNTFNLGNNHRGPFNYSYSQKRINSDKPTPCLQSKLQELRHPSNINGGILGGLNTISEASFIANNGTVSRMDNSICNTASKPKPVNMFEFFQPPELSETFSPFKDNIDKPQEDREMEDAKSEDSVEIHDTNLNNHQNEENRQIQEVIQDIREERRDDTRENSFGEASPDCDMQNLDQEAIENSNGFIVRNLEQPVITPLEVKTNEILNSHSMKDKYLDLCEMNQISLVLPVHYKSLLNLFSQMDQTINFLRNRKTPLSFINISKTVEQSLKRKFTSHHLQQILFVAPYMYNHYFEAKSRGYELMIEIPKNIRQIIENQKIQPTNEAFDQQMLSDLLEKRKDLFKQELYNITYKHYLVSKKQHQDFTSHQEQIELIDPLKDNQWPIFFDPHSVDEIPKAPMKEMPKTHKSQTITEFINQTNVNTPMISTQFGLNKSQQETKLRIDIQNQSYTKEGLNMTSEAVQLKQDSPIIQKKTPTSADEIDSQSTGFACAKTQISYIQQQATQYLSQDLIQLIKQKEDIITKRKQRNLDLMNLQDFSKKIETYQKLAGAIKIFFLTSNDANVLPFNQLLENLENKIKGQFNSRGNTYALFKYFSQSSY
ncbi:UNKNOWN [Stylonychia lemnae]|uniref:CDT1 Geminin-binding domain-containing protein n=1 Tax=Stylonychia lemnae TaxID=5949 RepID=A0A078BC19_STYLE|nr:UNKNOWN [Stylonychia lemnae]|eukprot:CDW91756.1 UNKNOWN [Stylonychia lemnae]